MPIAYIKKIDTKTIIGIWDISETAEEMQSLFPKNFTEIFPSKKITHTQKLLEYLSVRILLLKLCDSMQLSVSKFYEDANGKLHHSEPTFEFSLTHSFPLASVIISDTKVGIDIQKPSLKIFNIKDKFLSKKEQEIFSDNAHTLCIAWTAKEAIYKMIEEKCLFLDDLQIISYDEQQKNIHATFLPKNKEVFLHFFWFQDFCVTYTKDSLPLKK